MIRFVISFLSRFLDVSIRTYLKLETSMKFRKAFQRSEDDDSTMSIELQYDLPSSDVWSNV